MPGTLASIDWGTHFVSAAFSLICSFAGFGLGVLYTKRSTKRNEIRALLLPYQETAAHVVVSLCDQRVSVDDMIGEHWNALNDRLGRESARFPSDVLAVLCSHMERCGDPCQSKEEASTAWADLRDWAAGL